jgi:hypothetical protein
MRHRRPSPLLLPAAKRRVPGEFHAWAVPLQPEPFTHVASVRLFLRPISYLSSPHLCYDHLRKQSHLGPRLTCMTSPIPLNASRAQSMSLNGPSPLKHSSQRTVSDSATIRRNSANSTSGADSRTEPLDLTAQLLRSGHAVVKSRTGSVLSRGFIMKTDHYPSGSLGLFCSKIEREGLTGGVD